MTGVAAAGLDKLLYKYLNIRPQSVVENTLRLLIRTGLLVIDADEGSLLVHDRDANDLRFVMTVSDYGSEATLLGQRIPLGQGITGLAAATLDVQIGAPIYKDVQQSERLEGAGPEAVIAAPMLIGAETLVGVITAVSFRKGKRFTSDNGRLFGSFAAIAGVVVDQEQRLARLEGEVTGDATLAARSGLDHEIAASLGRIAQLRPQALEHLATLVTSVERLVLGAPGR